MKYIILKFILINLKFKNGQISRAMGLYDIVHPPMPMMQVTLYGTKGTMVSDFTDNEEGKIKVVFDKMAAKHPLEMTCPPEEVEKVDHITMNKSVKQITQCATNDQCCGHIVCCLY